MNTPKKEFTLMPFWFWNDDLSKEELNRQMMDMKEKGVDGFVIHPRMGLPRSISYLGDRYFEFVTYAVQRARELDMKVILYDEAMYPSGACHGEVVAADPAFASQGLSMSSEPREKGKLIARVEAPSEEEGKDSAKKPASVLYFTLVLSHGTIRGVHEGEDDGEPYVPKSADLLNPEAVDMFIHLTHDRYYAHLKEYFGNPILAFFTDEPNILGRNARKGLLPWSDGIYEEFLAAGGVKEDLPLLFAQEDTDKVIAAKRIYHRVIHERMARVYYKKLSDWCASHGIMLTGHPEKSTDIGYLSCFQLPCQDLVWRYVAPEEEKYITGEHSTMAKCSADSARHRGKRRNGNECFGVCARPETPYTFTETDMRWYFNWLMVRGVNFMLPHAFYYSIRDYRKDERPPQVGFHNPFWPDYRRFSNYAKRMCEAMTGGVNQAHVAVLCTDSFLSWRSVRTLYEHQVEFNYLEEELLNSCRVEEGCVRIRDQRYDLLLYDEDFRKNAQEESLKWLRDFEKAGGNLAYYEEVGDEGLLDLVRQLKAEELMVTGDRKNLRASYILQKDDAYVVLSNDGDTEIRFTLGVRNRRIVRIEDTYREVETEVSRKKEEAVELVLGVAETRIVYVQ